MKSGYAGKDDENGNNPERVEANGWKVMQPRWGWKFVWRMTQGSVPRNPGLKAGIPLGFMNLRAKNAKRAKDF
jgi:hypothetical protein